MSWVIVHKETKEPILETFDPKIAAAINTSKFEAILIMKYLQQLNQKIKNNES